MIDPYAFWLMIGLLIIGVLAIFIGYCTDCCNRIVVRVPKINESSTLVHTPNKYDIPDYPPSYENSVIQKDENYMQNASMI